MASLLDVLVQASKTVVVTTKEEFAEAMRSNDEDRKLKALQDMEMAGGYENLGD